MTADTSNVTITTKTIKVEPNMQSYLASIKQTSTLVINGEDVVVSFSLDPDSDEQDELLSGLTVETESEKIKKAFGSKTDTFTFENGIQAFNDILAKVS